MATCYHLSNAWRSIDPHDHGIIAGCAAASAGITGSDVCDIMLEVVEARFGAMRATTPVEMPSDNGSAYTARETRTFARLLGLKPCFTPVRSPQSNGISEAFVHTLKHDCVRVSSLADPLTALTSLAGWIEVYNDDHPIQGSNCDPRTRIAHSFLQTA
ncbi:hypothetical protein GCM10020258_32710 [Sphingomonas yabuuchiae]